MNPFSWIRTAVKLAFIGGVHDAIVELSPDAAVLTVTIRPLAVPDVQQLPAVEDQPAEEAANPTRRKKPA